jgi:sugar lactone lactonase YvrE
MDRGVVICVADDPGLVFSQDVGLPDLQIAMMTEDAKGAIWIGYLSGGSRVGRRTR